MLSHTYLLLVHDTARLNPPLAVFVGYKRLEVFDFLCSIS